MLLQKFFEGEKYVTVSWIPYFLDKIRTGLKAAVADTDCEITAMATLMLTQFKQRFGDGSVATIPVKVALAASVDPRTKQLTCLNHSDKQKVWNELRAYIVAMRPASDSNPEQQGSDVMHEDDDSQDMFAGAQTATASSTTELGEADAYAQRVDREIAEWKCTPTLPHSTRQPADPLSWWAKHHLQFPLIAQVAKQVLCIPATSAASERLFSIGGLTVTDNRNALTEENTGRLVFLRGSWETAVAQKAAGRMAPAPVAAAGVLPSVPLNRPLSSADRYNAMRTAAENLPEGTTAAAWTTGGTGRGSGVPAMRGGICYMHVLHLSLCDTVCLLHNACVSVFEHALTTRRTSVA